MTANYTPPIGNEGETTRLFKENKFNPRALLDDFKNDSLSNDPLAKEGLSDAFERVQTEQTVDAAAGTQRESKDQREPQEDSCPPEGNCPPPTDRPLLPGARILFYFDHPWNKAAGVFSFFDP